MKNALAIAVDNPIITNRLSSLKELLVTSIAAGGTYGTVNTWLGDLVLTGDGYVSYRIEDNIDRAIYGITDATSIVSLTYQLAKPGHRILTNGTTNSLWWYNGANAASGSAAVIGSILTFTRTGSTIVASINGITQRTYTSAPTGPMRPLVTFFAGPPQPKVTLYDFNGQEITAESVFTGSGVSLTLNDKA